MRTTETQTQIHSQATDARHYDGGVWSQAKFEAMFDHTPKVDTRTPAQVRAS